MCMIDQREGQGGIYHESLAATVTIPLSSLEVSDIELIA